MAAGLAVAGKTIIPLRMLLFANRDYTARHWRRSQSGTKHAVSGTAACCRVASSTSAAV